MATKSKDFGKAERLGARNRQILRALRDCRELVGKTEELLERVHGLDRAAND